MGTARLGKSQNIKREWETKEKILVQNVQRWTTEMSATSKH